MEDEFMKQFTGSASANVVTVLLVGLLFVLRICVQKKCKKSKCHSLCIDLEIDTENGENENEDENSKSDKSSEEGSKRVHRLHKEHSKDVPQQHKETV